MPYWPSYSEIEPECRAAYLRWLADGRRDPTVGIGYVFLFFYGLERRILHDGIQTPLRPGEPQSIVAEVERLLSIYGSQGSFRRYASDFRVVAEIQLSSRRFSDGPPPPIAYPGQFPLALRMGLAEIVTDGRPIPANWALAWVRAHPETRLRTPAQRCASEFDRLFSARYAKQFGAGIVVKPNRTKIAVQYTPASASFGGAISVPIRDLPDVTALSGPVQRLREIAESCSEDLESYSRLLGRDPGSKGTISAIAVLPPELASCEALPEANDLFVFVRSQVEGQDVAVVMAKDMLQRWSAAAADGRFNKAEAVTLAQFLQKCGFGIEPDVRFGGRVPKLAEKVALFSLHTGSAAAPTPQFRAASALLHMAVLVAQADGTVDGAEQARFVAHIEGALHLEVDERRRLRAHLQWQIANKTSLADVKKNAGHLDPAKRHALGAFLVGVAAADGRLDRKEIATLSKLYSLLAIPDAHLFEDLHSFGLSRDVDEGPITVSAADPSRGFTIPAPDRAEQDTFTLDPLLVQAKLAESAAVAALLEGIFTQEDSDVSSAPARGVQVPALAGLDAEHSALLRELATKTAWERAHLEACTARLSLLPDGAIETINERALDLTGEPLLEGEDPVSVNPAVLKELMV